MKYTYLFHRASDGLTKIGRSNYPKRRFEQLGGHKSLVVIAVINGDCEKSLHQQHASCRAAGEWFNLNPDVLRDFIKKHGQALPDDVSPSTARLAEKHILFAPVSKATQAKVQMLAKSRNIPIRVLCAMLIEQGLEDMSSGKIQISPASITTHP